MNEVPPRRVLVADTAGGFDSIRVILGDAVQLAHALTFDQAVFLINTGPDMVMCGVHFDESRMFDVLRIAAATSTFKGKPLICYRDQASALPAALFQSVEIACQALGPARFIDLYDLKARYGIERADVMFRDLVLNHLTIEGT